MRRSFISSSKFVLVFLSLWFSDTAQGQTGKNFVQVNYTYPISNSTQVSARTTLGIRYDEELVRSALQPSAFAITGASSGIHIGKITLALDGRTVIFTPEEIFFSGERVLVNIGSLKCLSGKTTARYSFTFQISASKMLPHSQLIRPPDVSSSITTTEPWIKASNNSNDTLPSDFPTIYFTKRNNPAPGNIYLCDQKSSNNDKGNYLMLLDNQGNVVFGRSMWPSFATDFKMQPNGLLTYFDNDLGINSTDFRYCFYGMDSNYDVRDTFTAANGYLTDNHELVFLPGGGYALIAQMDEQLDTRKLVPKGYKGDSNTTIVAGIIQEFDMDKNLIFEWRSIDHFAISDMTNTQFDFTFLDFTHTNSIENDGDTAFITSSRNLDEITKISRKDGHIIWRWGGKNNQFTFVNDSLSFSRQHAVRRLKNGNIIMFDNGIFHPTTLPYSRAVEYRLDEKAKIATQVWDYHHDPEAYSSIMGNVQELDNGNRLIGWGGCDSGYAVTEVKPDGSTALEISFDLGVYSYRAFKFTKDQFKLGISLQMPDPNLTLSQNYPNPFSGSSTVNFRSGERTVVDLNVYDALGRLVKTLFNGIVDAGNYSAKFDAGNLPSGPYLCKLSTPLTTLTRIMLLSK